ncbi:hypothetical protein GCM10010094_39900 [Streptomyces flaveus]|uniref:Uncharacterized protein n=1 Tax=Streptomyces flaveus TaxID=66370 RepID=A0A917QYB4_9ACTN|nr:hypothetical protein GCM10010094_39900 [Streptomyces flaveus]
MAKCSSWIWGACTAGRRRSVGQRPALRFAELTRFLAPPVEFTAVEWTDFLAGAKLGEFDLSA